MTLRVVYAGTPEFAVPALAALAAAGHPIVAVYTQPDRPAGRGRVASASPVKQAALALGIPVRQSASLKDAAAELAALAPELIEVAAYGLMLPPAVLALPRLGCVNIHASLLPRWRGAAPIQRAIAAGDAQTGITLMQMDAGLDTGAMLAAASVPITPDDTAASLLPRLSALGAQLTVQTLAGALPSGVPQPPDGISYADKIDKSEALIDWRAPAEQIERRLRAFDPFPGAHFVLAGQAIKLWRASVVDAMPGLPGQVLYADASRCVVACGQGALALQSLQRPGGRRQDVATWLQAQPGLLGQRLGGVSRGD